MGYPKDVRVYNINPELYGSGHVLLSIEAVVPEEFLQYIMNHIGEVL